MSNSHWSWVSTSLRHNRSFIDHHPFPDSFVGRKPLYIDEKTQTERVWVDVEGRFAPPCIYFSNETLNK